MTRFPIQARPVTRPDLVQPHTMVDVSHGDAEDLVSIRSRLMHGANYNDPPPFRIPTYQQMKWGCYTCPTDGWS